MSKLPLVAAPSRASPARNKPYRIGMLTYTACMGAEVFAVNDVLLIAQHIARATGYTGPLPELELLTVSGRQVTLAGGVVVQANKSVGAYDLLVVPGLEVRQLNAWDAALAPLGKELRFIQKTFASGTPVASICVGSFLLAQAGLLDGRHATTAWLCVPDFAARYPGVLLNPTAVLLEDGAVITTGAVSSAFDLGLHIVAKTLGHKVAAATARVALLSTGRSSQAPFVDRAMLAPREGNFADSVAQWMAKRLAEPLDLDGMAQAFHVSARTLHRRVKAQTGLSPVALLQQVRIDRAKHLLTTTSWSLPRITEAVGYVDVPTFSRLFASRVGETPARYRKR